MSENYQKISIGDYVEIGNYWDGITMEKQPIEWLVLDVDENNYALVITKYCIECMSYHDKETDITWENSDIRRWLNTDFLNNAFSGYEHIRLTEVVNNDNPEFKTRGGNITKDRIFLLSIDEAEKYFSSCEDKQCYATKYAFLIENHICSWRLRSPGGEQCYSAIVDLAGQVEEYGSHVTSTDDLIRPALWIKL